MGKQEILLFLKSNPKKPFSRSDIVDKGNFKISVHATGKSLRRLVSSDEIFYYIVKNKN